MRARWWAALPLAVVLVLAASGSRLQIYWWPSELRDETSGRQGEPVAAVDVWKNEDGEHERRFTVTLVDVRRAVSVEGFDGPERVEPAAGTAVWEVVLEFDVDPDVPMGLCEVSLIDTAGREADARGGSVGDVFLPVTDCEPQNRRGPDYTGARDEDLLPRLPTYRVAEYVVTADDAEPASVRLWWEPTDYVEIDVATG